MKYECIQVQPMAGSLGAEVSGVDLSDPLDDQTIGEIQTALFENLVLGFREQDITPVEHLAFARRFGDILTYPLVKGLADYPEIVPVLKLEDETINFGGIWHSDTAYLKQPPMAAVLVARDLPPHGGDTMWSNMYAAYEALSDGMKAMLDGLIAVNTADKGESTTTRAIRREENPKDDSGLATVAEHPVIRTHPGTGRKFLYVNIGHTTHFKDMSEEESAPILNYLFQHQIRPEFTCRMKWEPGTVAFWDNRASQHNPVNDYHGYRRLMHRVTIAGETPV
jgi:taurine dioxygenase